MAKGDGQPVVLLFFSFSQKALDILLEIPYL